MNAVSEKSFTYLMSLTSLDNLLNDHEALEAINQIRLTSGYDATVKRTLQLASQLDFGPTLHNMLAHECDKLTRLLDDNPKYELQANDLLLVAQLMSIAGSFANRCARFCRLFVELGSTKTLVALLRHERLVDTLVRLHDNENTQLESDKR